MFLKRSIEVEYVSKGDNSNFNVQNSFFLPLEYEYTVKDNVPSKKE